MANIDTLPLYGMQESSGSFRSVVAKAAGVELKPFWAAVFARTLEKADLAEMLNAQPAAAAPAAAPPAPRRAARPAAQSAAPPR